MIEYLNNIYYGNTINQWLIALSIVVGGYLIGKIIYWIFGNIIKKLTSKTKTNLDDIIVDMVEEPIMLAIILAGFYYAITYLILSKSTLNFLMTAINFVITLNIAWMISRLSDSLFKEYITPIADKTKSEFDDQILPIIKKSINFIIWILAIVVGLDNAGYNIGALLAGLGIGGLALAMAAKDTITNIFGGIMIFLDKPFKIKDRIKIAGFDGTIEEIGLRSTRLRTLSGTLVTIPNSTFSENAVENITREPSRKVVLNLGLTYDTDEKGIEKAIELIHKIAKNNKDNIKENHLVSFNSFGDFSLGILFIYYIKKSANILDTQTKINLDILKEFNKAKLSLAFPTQTIEIKK